MNDSHAQEYERLVAILDRIGDDETHSLVSLMEVIGALVEKYEDERVPELDEL